MAATASPGGPTNTRHRRGIWAGSRGALINHESTATEGHARGGGAGLHQPDSHPQLWVSLDNDSSLRNAPRFAEEPGRLSAAAVHKVGELPEATPVPSDTPSPVMWAKEQVSPDQEIRAAAPAPNVQTWVTPRQALWESEHCFLLFIFLMVIKTAFLQK